MTTKQTSPTNNENKLTTLKQNRIKILKLLAFSRASAKYFPFMLLPSLQLLMAEG